MVAGECVVRTLVVGCRHRAPGTTRATRGSYSHLQWFFHVPCTSKQPRHSTARGHPPPARCPCFILQQQQQRSRTQLLIPALHRPRLRPSVRRGAPPRHARSAVSHRRGPPRGRGRGGAAPGPQPPRPPRRARLRAAAPAAAPSPPPCASPQSGARASRGPGRCGARGPRPAGKGFGVLGWGNWTGVDKQAGRLEEAPPLQHPGHHHSKVKHVTKLPRKTVGRVHARTPPGSHRVPAHPHPLATHTMACALPRTLPASRVPGPSAVPPAPRAAPRSGSSPRRPA